MKRYQIILLVASLFFSLGYFTCYDFSSSLVKSQNISKEDQQKLFNSSTLGKIIAKKRLDVIILNSPTVYYMGAVKEKGFEYELIKNYADSIGVDLNLTVVHTVEEALEYSKKGIGDITLAGTTVTDERKKEFRFGPQYFTIQELLVCGNALYRQKKFPKNVDEMLGLKIVLGAGTSYVKTIKRIQNDVDGLEYNLSEEYSTEELLKQVSKNEIDCTIADSNIFAVNQKYYPELSRSLVLSDRKNLAWILRDGDDSLKNGLYKWLNNVERSGVMSELKDFYFSYMGIFDYYDTTTFYKRIKTKLPKYKKLFKQAAKEYKIPWILLAAQSYQESHWNPRAKSHTGVRGMMMLTRPTAKQLGIKNRLDAKQSIFGGAKYLVGLEKRFDKNIVGNSRWAFTLAAYNVGMGHLHDAQILARKLNRDPYLWSSIKEVLPLLSERKYYKHAKHGYARGDEPVRYVNSILHYVNILNKAEKKKQ